MHSSLGMSLHREYTDYLMGHVINPRHTSAARVMVVCSVCVSVCLSVCYHASEGITQFYAKEEIRTALV